ncbi:MAG: permease [Clostridiales bacterium]|nr:permease [Clostridiales bacterium]
MKILKFLKKNTLFTIGMMLYGLVAIIEPGQIKSVAYYSYIYFKELFEVLPLIVLLATVIDAWIPKELILKKLGKDSGKMGYFYAYIIGSISAGPIYASFPIVRLLMEKGASVGNAVIIISAWAVIKVPMLVNEVKFLGMNYMILRWVLTIIAIFIMSQIVQKSVSKEEALASKSNSKIQPLEIIEAYCIGCGICSKISPADFEIIDEKAKVKEGYSLGPTIKAASNKCPTNAIVINGKRSIE